LPRGGCLPRAIQSRLPGYISGYAYVPLVPKAKLAMIVEAPDWGHEEGTKNSRKPEHEF